MGPAAALQDDCSVEKGIRSIHPPHNPQCSQSLYLVIIKPVRVSVVVVEVLPRPCCNKTCFSEMTTNQAVTQLQKLARVLLLEF